jgi:hypothetical protein
MDDWKTILKGDSIDWLLEASNPSVRYFTLSEILDKPENDSEVKIAKKEIMKSGVVPKILIKQNNRGYWGIAEDFYVRTKYKGTVWSLILLAELGASKNDDRIKKACEFLLKISQDNESGGFCYHGTEENGGMHEDILPCLTGNMIWSLIRFGYLEDPRVQNGINWIVKYQRFDDGIDQAPKGWPYKREQCWGKHTCHMGVVKILKALTEIPPSKRSKNVNNTIENAAEYLLKHHLYKRSHNLSIIGNQDWIQFGFPRLWQTDVLEMLEILTHLGYNDERMLDAVNLVIKKQDNDGKWNMERTFNGRFQTSIEQKGKSSKWITLYALIVLKRFYS